MHATRLVCLLTLSVGTGATPIDAQELGRIEFPTSAQSARAQELFERGVLLLHSFEYEDAREAFRAAQAEEPGFAMACWGEALTFHHPIWRREEPDDAREALAQLGATPAERRAKVPTDKELQWLGSVEILFGEGPRNERWTGYSDALAAMHARYPHDVEVGALYSLSVLGTSFGGRDFRIYMRAAGIAQKFYARYPQHPGLLHYLIHSYDDPVHAPLGIEMAKSYDKVAPAAEHALHMPSHIYVALGMWQESIAANIASFAAGDARRERKQLGVDERAWHACQWLAYSYLQSGQVAAAAAQLALVEEGHRESRSKQMRHHLVLMRAAHAVATDFAPGFRGAEVSVEGLRLSTMATHHFVRGMFAMHRDEIDAARSELEALRVLAPDESLLDAVVGGTATCCAPSGERPETEQDRLAAAVMRSQLHGALAAREGRTDEALAAMRQACAREDQMGFDFGPPVVAKPAHEQLGEYLLRLGRAEEAVAKFDAAVARAPGRARSLLGKARALQALGAHEGARSVYRQLATQWQHADPGLPDLEDVRTAAAGGGSQGSR